MRSYISEPFIQNEQYLQIERIILRRERVRDSLIDQHEGIRESFIRVMLKLALRIALD